jgi:hypothetical protein
MGRCGDVGYDRKSGDRGKRLGRFYRIYIRSISCLIMIEIEIALMLPPSNDFIGTRSNAQRQAISLRTLEEEIALPIGGRKKL